MRRGEFTLNGVSSLDYGVLIQDRPDIQVPIRRVQMRTAYGTSGDMPFDEEQSDGEKVYDNTTMNLSLLVLANGRTASENRNRIANWMSSNRYKNMIPYFDTKKLYQVMLDPTQQFNLQNKDYLGEIQVGTAVLTVRPWKLYVEAPKIQLSAAGAVFNAYLEDSLPLITIYGTGDVTLTVNGVNYLIQNIVTNITLDSERLFGYKEATNGFITNENAKVRFKEYPRLKTGVNTISWSGNVTKVVIDPRWRALA